jgi:hypothetical protein
MNKFDSFYKKILNEELSREIPSVQIEHLDIDDGGVCAVIVYRGKKFALWDISVTSEPDGDTEGGDYFNEISNLFKRKSVWLKRSIDKFIKKNLKEMHIDGVGQLTTNWESIGNY